MQVICFEDQAFYEMLDRLYQRYKAENNIKEEKWITGEVAMKRLGISSKTTLQKFRDEGRIRFVPITPKNFLYDNDSINAYLEDNACNTF